MPQAVIVDVIRTPCGGGNGSLSGWHPVDLAGEVLRALVERSDVDPALVDDVVMGCESQVGAQGFNVGRNAVLAAGFPDTVPATSIDRRCGSSQQAAAFAAQAIMAGVHDIVIAAGVEVMSVVPQGATFGQGVGTPFGPRVEARFAALGGLIPLGIAAERVAERWELTRDDLDAYAARSQQRAARARDEGRFAGETLPVIRRAAEGQGGRRAAGELQHDEAIREGVTAADLAGLRPALTPDGVVTAGNAAPIADGAAAALVTSDVIAEHLGLRPRARFHAFALAGVDPREAPAATVPATRRVLERAGLDLDDIDLIEIHEGFASAVLAWERSLHPDMAKVNVNGGAIALGHPGGASGARMLATLVNELERTGGRWGLQTTAEEGGTANATIVERLG